ncbi:MAG: hypothetical protein FWC53_01025 [Firmicutes bacterium]|nr:hypothetical protein [Bacillota bacterium]
MNIVMNGEDFHSVKKILEKYEQEYLLSFYNELENVQKEMLLHQILNINFEQITNLYKNSYIEDDLSSGVVTPLPYIDKSKLSSIEIADYEQIGINAIKSGKFAVITLSGGSGTRLRAFRP